MTIYNFRYLYDNLHHLEERFARLFNFKYKDVYLFSRLETFLDLYLQIYSYFIEIQNIKQNKELSHWKLFKSVWCIDGTIIGKRWVKDLTESQTCNKNEIQKLKFLANNSNAFHYWVKCSFFE